MKHASNPRLGKLKEMVISELFIDEVIRHMRYLVEEIGERLAGTESMARAAEYIRSALKGYGVESWIDEFYIYSSLPGSSELKVLDPEQLVVESFPNLHSPSTLPEGIEGELVYVGAGGEDDFKNRDVRGKIVLAELSYSPPRPEKVKNAERNGAKAVIIMNWGPRDKKVIGRGAIKWVWGNPTPETWPLMPKIPSINISRAAGEYLKKLLEKHGHVRVWLRLDNIREWVKAKQPMGIIRGTVEAEKFILVNGHLEAWGKTATCNSCGNAAMLELARVFMKHKSSLRRSIMFAFWDGHEIAEAAGSTWFVDKYWANLNRNCIAYINIDSPGLKGASVYVARAPPETWDLIDRIGEEFNINIKKYMPRKTGDNSVLGIGIPYIGIMATYTERELREILNWATLGWWYHSNEDTLDKVDNELLMEHLKLYASLILELCNSPIIPFNFNTTANYITYEISELEKLISSKLQVDLSELKLEAEKFMKLTREFNEVIGEVSSKYDEASCKDEKLNKKVQFINRALMKLCRIITPAFRSVAGRYGQDPYGLTALTKPLPRLYDVARRLIELSPCANEYHIYETKFMRERNVLVDSLMNANEVIEMTLELVK